MYNVKISIKFSILSIGFKTTDKICYEIFKFPFIPTQGLIVKISENLKCKIIDSVWNVEEDQFEASLDFPFVESFDEIPFEFRTWNFI